MNSKKIQILHTSDDKGQNVVRVPLSNSDKCVTLYETDFTELLDLGIVPRWNLASDGGVAMNTPGRTNLRVARLVLDAANETVCYLSGDKTDLRRSNIVLNGNKGNAKTRARDLVCPTPQIKQTISIEHVSTVRPISAGSVMT